MKKYSEAYLKKAHKESIFHENLVVESKLCGCFYCQVTFDKLEITNWTDENSGKGKTAFCPFCGIDSVLTDNFPIQDKEFLKALNEMYFDE